MGGGGGGVDARPGTAQAGAEEISGEHPQSPGMDCGLFPRGAQRVISAGKQTAAVAISQTEKQSGILPYIL